MIVSKVKIFNILFFLFLIILGPYISFSDSNGLTINGSELKIVDGHYEAELSVQINRESDAFISMAKSDAQIKIIEDLIFNTIYNNKLLNDIKSESQRNLLSRLATNKLLNNKLLIKGLSEVEHRIEEGQLFLIMRIEKSKFDEAINKGLR